MVFGNPCRDPQVEDPCSSLLPLHLPLFTISIFCLASLCIPRAVSSIIPLGTPKTTHFTQAKGQQLCPVTPPPVV